MNYPHPILAKEGWPFIAASFVLAVLASSAGFWALPFWVVFLFCVQFFRDPARVIAGGPASQEAWGVADFEKLLPQLAKLKFNAVILPGSVKATGFDPVSVTGDIAGRSVFGGAKEFRNPDLTGETGADAI